MAPAVRTKRASRPLRRQEAGENRALARSGGPDEIVAISETVDAARTFRRQ
jgi:hypothetical protein